jgi:methionyl-tRNA formyltransferase
MTADFDAGPVYQKRALSLEGSSAEEIYIRASRASCEMAVEIALAEPVPQPQIGPVVSFRRRKSADSILPDTDSLCEVFDHIRMLDADGYPSAFVVVGGLRIEFSRATLYHDGVRADVRISVNDVDTEL